VNETIKKVILIAIFGIIVYFALMFIIYTGVTLVIWVVGALALVGAYKLWEDYAKKELLKREENFNILKEKSQETINKREEI